MSGTTGVLPQLTSPVTVDFAQYVNARRAKRWHGEAGVKNWSGLEWAGAMCGEAGEAANVAKKLRRVELELEGNEHSERIVEATELVPALARELADTFFYMLLLAERYEINMAKAIRDTFNKKSEEMGFPERL